MRTGLLRFATTLTVFATLVMAGTPAQAEEPAAEEAAPAAKLIGGLHPFALTHVDPISGAILGGIITDPGLILALGLALQFDGNRETDKTTFGFTLIAQYMAVNMARFAMGPELVYSTKVAGPDIDAFGDHTLAPGWAFWFAPFPVPLAFGTSWSAALNFGKGKDFSFGLQTPDLRLCWIFG